jgi:hypothetical protein
MTGDGRGGVSNSVLAATDGGDSTVLKGVRVGSSGEGCAKFEWRTGSDKD